MAGCKAKGQAAVVPPPAPARPVHLSPYEPTNALPADLFKLFPAYPGATVIHVFRPKGVMREIWYNGGAKPQFSEMAAFYKDNLPKGGFRVTSPLMLAGRKTFSCQFNKDGRQGSLEIYPSEADKLRLTIDLTYEMPEKVDQAMVEPKEVFDVIGPGPVAQNAPNSTEETKRN